MKYLKKQVENQKGSLTFLCLFAKNSDNHGKNMWHKTRFFSANYIPPLPHHINVDLHIQEAQIFIPQH